MEVGFWGLDLRRMSTVFLEQVFQRYFGRVVNVFQISDEMQCLEGVGRRTATKKEDRFRHVPLKVLWKTRFTDASFIPKNLSAHFGVTRGGNEKLIDLITHAFKSSRSGYVDDDFAKEIAHNFTIEAMLDRAKGRKMTGEWIVYKKHEGKNYYLTLAAHAEDDDSIYQRVCDAYEFDFPFLRETDQVKT